MISVNAKSIENRMDKTAVSNASTVYFNSTELHINFFKLRKYFTKHLM